MDDDEEPTELQLVQATAAALELQEERSARGMEVGARRVGGSDEVRPAATGAGRRKRGTRGVEDGWQLGHGGGLVAAVAWECWVGSRFEIDSRMDFDRVGTPGMYGRRG